MMKYLKKKVVTHSVHSYMRLYSRIWLVEFEVNDFGATLSTLFELPLPIYRNQRKEFFWKFITEFLEDSSLGFIHRNDFRCESTEKNMNLALIGFWSQQKLAIPLWILNDTLLGFEVIHSDTFIVLDSYPLLWRNKIISEETIQSYNNENNQKLSFTSGLFSKDTVHFKIKGNMISLYNFSQQDELEFFTKIASAIIPELEEIEENQE